MSVGRVKISEVAHKDIGDLVSLFAAMQEFYGSDKSDIETTTKKLEVALGEIGSGFLLIAKNTKPIGFATFAKLFPASNLEPTWFLKDLFVLENARGLGVGGKLMRFAAKKILEKGGKRLDLTTDLSNSGAMRFYDRISAKTVDKVYYRYDAEELENLAKLSDM